MSQIETAITYVEQGDTQKGLDLLKEQLGHANHEEKYVIAQLYQEWGLTEDAKAIVDELLMLYPDEGELYLLSAELLIDQDEEDEALEMLMEIKEDDPVYVQGLLLMADLYELQGLEEAAEQKLLIAKKKAPEESLIDFGLGEFYLSRGEYKKSIPYYERVLQEQTSVAETNIHLRLAEAMSMAGQFEEALTYYEKGLKEKTELNALFGYAFTAYQVERYQTAISKLEELKEIDPNFTALYTYLAKSYEAEGALEEAYEAVKAGLKADEFNKELLLYGAKLVLKLQDPHEAEHLLREALALDPGYIEAAFTLSKLYLQQERYEDVVELIEHLIEYGETDPKYEWDLGFAKNQLELYSEAIKHYDNAYNFFKDNMEFLEEYGQFLIEEGRRNEAKQIFTRMLKLDPTLLHIEELLYQLEDED